MVENTNDNTEKVKKEIMNNSTHNRIPPRTRKVYPISIFCIKCRKKRVENHHLFFLMITLIILLLSFCVIIEGKMKTFKRECAMSYDVNGTCPCEQVKFNKSENLLFSGNSVFNATLLNVSMSNK